MTEKEKISSSLLNELELEEERMSQGLQNFRVHVAKTASHALTVKQLRQTAKELKIKNYSKMKKSKLVEAITEASQPKKTAKKKY